ncbi:MAG: recombinase family protein [Christensenellales bacterium]
MKKVQIDPATQRRPTSRKQNRSARIKEQLTQQVEVQVIPAKADMEGYERPKPRVCAYCRVSTDMDTQALSYELQVQNYTEYITSNPDWEFAGIYADKGISGTSLRHRDNFNRMIADCEAGKIDLIVTKAVTRFARNVVDAISTVRKLKQLSPPVGVYFETERINTLDTTSETYLGLISLFAQGESESKSESLKWSYIRRWKRGTGIYPTWSLLGYEVDEEGHWVIVENEAELIRVIYDMYLNGHSSPQIAEILTRSGIPTATNKSVWSSGAVLGILRNEKYCGDVLCQKTITLDVFTHKSVKNKGDKKQYFIEGHHEAIIDKDDWLLVQKLIRERHYYKNRRRRRPRIMIKGCLAGFALIDLGWDDDDIESIFTTSKTTAQEACTSENIEIIEIKGE